MHTKVWYPYQQMQERDQFPIVEKAQGCILSIKDGPNLIDAISSWWCVIHGYNHPEINKAITDQLQSVSHVMMGGITNQAAEDLAQKLISISPEGLNHVFFSDSGSVGIEVALKMAIQYHSNKRQPRKHILSLNKSYHGDTFKTMEVGDDPCYHGAFIDLFDNRSYIKPPYGWPSDEIESSIIELRREIEKHKDNIAAFIVEPLLQGAGGFRIYDPEFLNQAYSICKEYDILMIFDEVVRNEVIPGLFGSLTAFKRKILKELNVLNASQYTINVKEDDIILFPSKTPHATQPTNTNDERISISADIVCIAKSSEILEHLTPPFENWTKM